MMKIRLILAVFASLILTCSCKSQFELLLQSHDADEKFKAAFDYFDNGKYSKAASLFESLSMLTNGTERDDTVRYYWAHLLRSFNTLRLCEGIAHTDA